MLPFPVLFDAINCFVSCVGAGQRSEITVETDAPRILHGPQRKVSEVDPYALQRLSTISAQPHRGISEGAGAARCRQDPANATGSICDLN